MQDHHPAWKHTNVFQEMIAVNDSIKKNRYVSDPLNNYYRKKSSLI